MFICGEAASHTGIPDCMVEGTWSKAHYARTPNGPKQVICMYFKAQSKYCLCTLSPRVSSIVAAVARPDTCLQRLGTWTFPLRTKNSFQTVTVGFSPRHIIVPHERRRLPIASLLHERREPLHEGSYEEGSLTEALHTCICTYIYTYRPPSYGPHIAL